MRNARTLVGWVALAGGLACGDVDGDPATPAPIEADAEDGEADDQPCEIPSEPEALRTYLDSGAYKAFAARETAPHASAVHGGQVLTYVNDLLATSLAAGNATHPRCAAAVKELFLGGSDVGGWAVLLKSEAESAGGRGYYWYEITSRSRGASPDFEGHGIGVCVGCHGAGRDYVRVAWPLP